MAKSQHPPPAASGVKALDQVSDKDEIARVRKDVLNGVKTRAKATDGAGRLKGRVGVITGVGPELGIGTAAARLFAREGAAHIYLVDYDEGPIPAFLKSLEQSFPFTKVTFIKADAADHKVISTLISSILEEEGHLDFFFANAGISQLRPRIKDDGEKGMMKALGDLKALIRPVAEVAEDEFNEIMRINALGVFIAIKYASTAMGKVCPEKGKTIPGGSIILTASIAGLKANAGPIAYSASKAAVVSMAQTASYDLTGKNIRVNAICPGLIETDMTRGMFTLAEKAGKMDKMGSLNPALRQGLGVEVAQVALFLASDESSYVNGQAIPVDGGLTAGVPYTRFKL
ncbi:hypothetical protein CI109_104066 [Kwoniella shandongensis]|uniref:Uncharacterized protein n=1 Tax=Kwoniella shandongensis TaxID=1734106 RepID=A0A5M6BZ48_9TREE|nr:uncharacterized protein CI109_004048 [Kwoniella shandongensis]KAA5527510.1 hypothetical protein CI109_004048 [Kwoniella shandongensis]